MSEQPLVSVVIATYNMGQYLPLAIDSVLNQSWSNLEVVVIDDGSQDDTPEQMTRYEKDTRVRYFPTENRGQPQAKNKGLQESKGDFIAFCDADDLWQPCKLEVQQQNFLGSLCVGLPVSLKYHIRLYTSLWSLSTQYKQVFLIPVLSLTELA